MGRSNSDASTKTTTTYTTNTTTTVGLTGQDVNSVLGTIFNFVLADTQQHQNNAPSTSAPEVSSTQSPGIPQWVLIAGTGISILLTLALLLKR